METGRLEKLLPLSGVVFAICLAAAFFASGETPDTTDSPEKILDFYDDGKLFIGIIGLGLAAIFFMFFAAAMRRYLIATGPEWLASLWFGAGVLFVVALTGFATSQFSLLSAADEKNLSVMQSLNYIDNNNFPPAVVAVCVIMFATAWHVLKAKSLPTWIGWISLVLGIVALLGPIGFLAFLAFVPWSLIVSILVYRRGMPVTAAA
jgi:hypothetical protein